MTEKDKGPDLDKIKARIQALLNTEGRTEQEAAAYNEKAFEMMAEYGLSMDQIEANAKRDHEVTHDKDFETDSQQWMKLVVSAVAEMYFCQYFFGEKRVTQHSKRYYHCFIGEAHNIVVAKMMAAYLVTTVTRLSWEGAKSVPKEESFKYRHSFKHACAIRIARRIREKVEQAKAGKMKASDGRNLPALISMYDQAAAANASYADKRWKFKQVPARTRASHGKGIADGSAAGERVSLDTQVGGRAKATQIGRQ